MSDYAPSWVGTTGTAQRGRLKNGKGGRPRLGYACIHSAVDAYSRLAYSEVRSGSSGFVISPRDPDGAIQ